MTQNSSRTMVEQWARLAVDQGWRVETGRPGRLKFQPPHGPAIFASTSPTDWRASKNIRAYLRRAGLAV